jgi:hypothetical protein
MNRIMEIPGFKGLVEAMPTGVQLPRVIAIDSGNGYEFSI